jgi:type IV pilus assembly protein PilC
MFVRHLAVMLRGGLQLVECLECLRKQDESANFGVVVNDLALYVGRGWSLSAGLTLYPRVFPPLLCSMVKVGEETGQMTEVLNQVGDWLERDEQIRQRLKSVLTYPCLVLATAFLITLALFTFVVPQFVSIFQALGDSLPFITRVVIFLSDLACNPGAWIIGVIGVVALWFSVSELWDSPGGRRRITVVLMEIPLVGSILRNASIARFAAASSMSLGSGMNLMKALDLAAKACQNAVLESDVAIMAIAVSEGRSVSEHMKEHPELYTSMLVQTVLCGEESSHLDESLAHAAEYHEAETRYLVDGVSAAIEPIMLLGVGSLVGFILLSVFLPMYSYVSKL